MITDITWAFAFAVVASVVAIISGAIKIFKNEFNSRRASNKEIEDLRVLVQDAKLKINIVDNQISELKKDDTELKEALVRESRACLESFNKLEKKLEKITDLMIELIRTNNN